MNGAEILGLFLTFICASSEKKILVQKKIILRHNDVIKNITIFGQKQFFGNIFATALSFNTKLTQNIANHI